MKRQNVQSGFAAIEAVLILVIVALVAGTGYFVWHAKQNADTALNNASKPQHIVISKNPDTVEQKITDSRVASTFVEKTYATYLAALTKSKNISTAINAIKGNMSDDLFVSLLGKSASYDPMLCTQSTTVPENAIVTSTIPSTTVIGTDIDAGFSNQATIQANYDIKTRKIIGITCLFPEQISHTTSQ